MTALLPIACSFIGEESFSGKVELTDTPTWMVDPIDGTNNFIHAFPFSAVSIGLAVGKQPVVGVVYNFILDQMFAAKKGGGATMNGSPMKVSGCTGECKANGHWPGFHRNTSRKQLPTGQASVAIPQGSSYPLARLP